MPTFPSPIGFPDKEIVAFSELLRFALTCQQEFGIMAWFRGQADKSWKLKPRIFRALPAIQHPGYEPSLLNTFANGAPARHANCPAHEDHISWLILAEHYGLPTRLLDWTQSILTAAYFAVGHEEDGAADRDAAIWALNPCHLNEKQTKFCFILGANSDSAKPCAANAFSDARRQEEEGKKILALLPVESDARIQAQQSVFTIHGVSDALEEVLGEDERTLYKFVIPASSKEYLRVALTVLGIRQSILFPDLQNLAEDIESMTTSTYDHPQGVMNELLQGRIPRGWKLDNPGGRTNATDKKENGE